MHIYEKRKNRKINREKIRLELMSGCHLEQPSVQSKTNCNVRSGCQGALYELFFSGLEKEAISSDVDAYTACVCI